MGMWDGGHGWMDDVESDDDIEVVIALSVLPLLLAAILPLVADLAPPQRLPRMDCPVWEMRSSDVRQQVRIALCLALAFAVNAHTTHTAGCRCAAMRAATRSMCVEVDEQQ
ncbi:hypothetical protein HaLaN_31461 [Haematococcus lacustris]|uniref:Uncharacterized protein n=1 Tax=Haematococcus lacustris TaxID=44745 RepID=A0A6A0AI23_HAELA|nr:hypothetical protein HaLaN_31461 [Haematococcus lacustris]